MEVSEIFARLKAHMLEGMVFHDEMVRYYGFLNCDKWKNEHEWHYAEETEGYRQLCDYYMNHYNMLIPVEPMNRPDVIPESWYRYMRQDVDAGTKKNGMVADIYPRMGFTDAGGGRFVADTGNFKPLDTFITRRENS